MRKSIISGMIILGAGFSACNNSNSPTAKVNTMKTEAYMKNIVSIIEIPTANFSRAVAFYETILGLNIEEVDMGGIRMGVFPGDEEAVNVALVSGNDYKPSADGTIVYLDAGDDLQVTLDKISENGGKVILPKTEISPEMGFYAMFTDSEGNKLGLHSKN